MTATSRLRFRALRLLDEQPFETFGALMFGLVGIPLVLNGAEPNTISTVLPDPLVRLWAINLVVGSLLVLVGLGRGWQGVEKSGLSLLASACVAYAIVILYVAGTTAAFAAAILVAFGAACWRRRGAIQRVVVFHTTDLSPRVGDEGDARGSSR